MASYRCKDWLTEDKLLLIEGWSREGLSLEQIAHNMGICCTTLKEWRKRESPILMALKKGKEVVDFEVENALYKRAIGYTAEEKTEEYRVDSNGAMTLVGKKVNYKHIPPDTTAQIYWLKCRKREKWAEKAFPTSETSGGIVLLPEVSEDE